MKVIQTKINPHYSSLIVLKSEIPYSEIIEMAHKGVTEYLDLKYIKEEMDNMDKETLTEFKEYIGEDSFNALLESFKFWNL